MSAKAKARGMGFGTNAGAEAPAYEVDVGRPLRAGRDCRG
jgi:hypothetical protein